MSEKIIKQIDKSLEKVLNNIKKEYDLDIVDPILFSSIKEFVLRKGKRIRPMLLIYSYSGYQKNNKQAPSAIIDLSTCIEFLHNFMLIHDDIIDRSDLRRGKPTLHRLLAKAEKTEEQDKLGYDLSIIAGDIVYAIAIKAFLSIKEKPDRKEKALDYFLKTAVYTAMGEFADTLNGVKKINKVSEKDVLLNYSLKTSRYTFECPLVMGAMLAGADNTETKLLAEFGLTIGQAFQIQDDVIGVFDTQKNIGKSILSDIAECKKTILVSHAYSSSSSTKRKQFLKYFKKQKKNYSDLVAIRKMFIDAGSLEYSINEIKKRITKAEKILKKLTIKKKYKALIEEALMKLFKHSFSVAEKYKIS